MSTVEIVAMVFVCGALAAVIIYVVLVATGFIK